MDVEDALELLSSQFTNRAVRHYAVSRLREANDEVKGTKTSRIFQRLPWTES